ncbi:hypothetical protein LINPERPRIM_LOCUS30850, partial [Linum perenne]
MMMGCVGGTMDDDVLVSSVWVGVRELQVEFMEVAVWSYEVKTSNLLGFYYFISCISVDYLPFGDFVLIMRIESNLSSIGFVSNFMHWRPPCGLYSFDVRFPFPFVLCSLAIFITGSTTSFTGLTRDG